MYSVECDVAYEVENVEGESLAVLQHVFVGWFRVEDCPV